MQSCNSDFDFLLTNRPHWFFQVSYSLTHLAKSHLNKFRKEVAPHEVPKMFQAAESLMELVGASVLTAFYVCLFSYY